MVSLKPLARKLSVYCYIVEVDNYGDRYGVYFGIRECEGKYGFALSVLRTPLPRGEARDSAFLPRG